MIQDLLKSITFMSSQFYIFNKKLEGALLEMNHWKTENNHTKSEKKKLANEILDIKKKLSKLEQNNMGISIEITGIPKMGNENCITIVKKNREKNKYFYYYNLTR